MSGSNSSSAKSKELILQKVPPVVEPRIAYAEPHLSNVQILALVRGKTFLTANHEGNLMPPGAPHIGLFRDDTRYLSQLELRINGSPPVALSYGSEGAYAA